MLKSCFSVLEWCGLTPNNRTVWAMYVYASHKDMNASRPLIGQLSQ